jgi:urease accessory protein
MPDCTKSPNTIDDVGADAWHARLALGFTDDAGTTRLTERVHSGPLRVQKALYPEGGAVCHAIVVHPPGGVVGGDQLGITARVGDRARAFLSTPGAAKWYKANGRGGGQCAGQRVALHAGLDASIEWMPQESIFFDQAEVALEHEVTLAAGAAYIGCEILCLGRRASGETFKSGKITQRSAIRRDGKLIWWEQGALQGAGALQGSALGFDGRSVCATLIAVGAPAGAPAGAPLTAAALAALREIVVGGEARFGVTQTRDVLVARYLGDDSEAARRAMLEVWQRVRPHLIGRAGLVPRIWNT